MTQNLVQTEFPIRLLAFLAAISGSNDHASYNTGHLFRGFVLSPYQVPTIGAAGFCLFMIFTRLISYPKVNN